MSAFNAPIGNPPTLEWVGVDVLSIDSDYQRSLSAKTSQKLIRDIARGWDWRLCQPLAVARRPDWTLWVMDGQHRLEGAKMRGDIPHLPCVIAAHDSREGEAEAFVSLNRRRRALSSVDVFRADLVAGNEAALEVADIIKSAGLTIAPHSNYSAWKPGMLFCVPGIASSYRRHGRAITSNALVALAEAYEGQILQYAGQLLRGLFVVYATEGQKVSFDADAFIERLAKNSQSQWMRKGHQQMAATGASIAPALSKVMLDAYRAA